MNSKWYKEAVVYQVYPFSFMDADNDGWGDIAGIISKLDYIRELGATAIWFSPLYVSPDYDYGYDISDYCAIDPKFGTMEDFDRLLQECHKKELKVIMDMVLNHTSTEHPWFKAAISSPDSAYRDYYIIRKGKEEKGKLLPPTNWASTFTGSAWERIEGTEDFYLHLFCKEQADLNWENPRVRDEIVSILDFWLKKGVDGFRFDVFNMFSKVYPLSDDTSKSFQKGSPYFIDGPRMHEFLQELNERVLSHYDCYTVGESYHPSAENAHAYVQEENHELDSIFNFAHLDADNIGGAKFFKKPFDLLQFKDGLFEPQITEYEGGWNTLVLENHDNPRSVSRFNIDTKHYRYEAATMLATLTYLGFGTPFIYMGQEIGMTNSAFRGIDEMKDPVSHFVYDLLRGYHVPEKLAFSFINYGARDHARVPMAWDDSINGGFNRGAKTWQSVFTEYRNINAEKDLKAKKSVYRFYQKLLKLRKENQTFIYGTFREYLHDHKQIAAYSREYGGKSFLVIANFSRKSVSVSLEENMRNAALCLNNYSAVKKDGLTLTLQPYQAVVYTTGEEK